MKKIIGISSIIVIEILLFIGWLFISGRYIVMPTNIVIIKDSINAVTEEKIVKLLREGLEDDAYVWGIIIRREFNDGRISIIYKEDDKLRCTEEKNVKDEEYFMILEKSKINVSLRLKNFTLFLSIIFICIPILVCKYMFK